MTRSLTLVVVMSAALALASCTTTSAGSPMPDGTATGGQTNTTSAEPSDERPRDIDLGGKDPCGLIPQADYPKLGIERPGQQSQHPDFDSPHCNYPSSGAVTLVVTAGIEMWTEDRYNAEIEDAEPIDGFPTITVAANPDRWSCWAVVDVADGQSLMTTVVPIGDDEPDGCDTAYQFAESAMKTLVAS